MVSAGTGTCPGIGLGFGNIVLPLAGPLRILESAHSSIRDDSKGWGKERARLLGFESHLYHLAALFCVLVFLIYRMGITLEPTPEGCKD